jgi:histidine ammonia-lyase
MTEEYYWLDGESLTLDQLFSIIKNRQKIGLTERAKANVLQSRMVVEKAIQEQRVVYGVNTGFGKFSDIHISNNNIEQLQYNLVVSHATGVGTELSEEVVRAIYLLKINSLAKGLSGVRLEVIEKLIAMYHAGIIPIVPSKGSVGASGDLAPLAHFTLVLIGMGEAFFHGQRMSGNQALKLAQIEISDLKAKEGLALLNGLQVSTALACFAFSRLNKLALTADIIGAMTLDGLKGSKKPFDDRIQQAGGLPGQIEVGRIVRKLLENSEILESHRDCKKIQDAYSLRCIPQVHGTVREVLAFAQSLLEKAINSCTDNPLVFANDNEVISGGNFHGQPISMISDLLAMAATYLANISERRIEYMLDPATSEMAGFLTEEGGLNSGFMIAQVTAASLASANKVLAHPASVDSIPTSANKEDFVSMSCLAANKALEVMEHTEYILAIELLCSCQAIDLKRPLKSSPLLEKVHQHIRTKIPHLALDRFMKPDIEQARLMIAEGIVYEVVKQELQ